MKTKFIEWMKTQKRSNGKPYKISTIKRYVRALEVISKQIDNLNIPSTNLFSYSTFDEFSYIDNVIRSNPNFDKVNRLGGNGNGDLSAGMTQYMLFLKDLQNKDSGSLGLSNSDKPEEVNEASPMNVSETITYIENYIASKGFSFEPNLIRNFYLSLKTKPFVILAGISGTGKTKLVRLFAEAINAEYKLIPVRPDWSDSTDLFGHMNLSGKFISGSVIDFIVSASKDPTKPYILCLDEMNLARVEYYFSDFLSIIETRKFSDDNSSIVSDVLICKKLWESDPDAVKKYGNSDISIPDNLYIVGTVNMDETTFPFSKKVLDRANTIEFSDVNLVYEHVANKSDMKIACKNDFLKPEYINLPSDETLRQYTEDICKELEKINSYLLNSNSQIAYRVRDELVIYRVLNNKFSLLSESKAMDYEIMQKILPRLQGSSMRIKKTLCQLFVFCAGDFEGKNDITAPDLADNMRKTYNALVQTDDCKYPKSAKKLIDMMERIEEDGFTSFWA